MSFVSDHHESLVIVDGKSGELIINPKLETLAKYEKLKSELTIRRRQLGQDSLKIETYDGYKIKLLANIETCAEIVKCMNLVAKVSDYTVQKTF